MDNSPFFAPFATIICTIFALGAINVPFIEARAFFVFGDSLVDSGNNDYLITTARADQPPYGIDYPTHRPTGRFSNGLNIPDLISWVHFFFSLLIIYIYDLYYMHAIPVYEVRGLIFACISIKVSKLGLNLQCHI